MTNSTTLATTIDDVATRSSIVRDFVASSGSISTKEAHSVKGFKKMVLLMGDWAGGVGLRRSGAVVVVVTEGR